MTKNSFVAVVTFKINLTLAYRITNKAFQMVDQIYCLRKSKIQKEQQKQKVSKLLVEKKKNFT